MMLLRGSAYLGSTLWPAIIKGEKYESLMGSWPLSAAVVEKCHPAGGQCLLPSIWGSVPAAIYLGVSACCHPAEGQCLLVPSLWGSVPAIAIYLGVSACYCHLSGGQCLLLPSVWGSVPSVWGSVPASAIYLGVSAICLGAVPASAIYLGVSACQCHLSGGRCLLVPSIWGSVPSSWGSVPSAWGSVPARAVYMGVSAC